MLAPSINHSNYYFQMENETSIRYSFRVIRKVPTKFILEIINERKKRLSEISLIFVKECHIKCSQKLF